MINLFSVKLNNDYDFIQAELPQGSGSWLCSETNDDYIKGYSYEVTEGVATRIEQNQDFKIQNSIYAVIENVIAYLNNAFYIRNLNYNSSLFCDCLLDSGYYNFVFCGGSLTFKDGQISSVYKITKNDLIHVIGGRNRFFSYVTDVQDDTITVDNQNFVNCTEKAYILVSGIPQSVQKIISQIINYDIFYRDVPNDLQSEHIGNYSYTKANYSIGSMAYPSEIVGGLETFKKVSFT